MRRLSLARLVRDPVDIDKGVEGRAERTVEPVDVRASSCRSRLVLLRDEIEDLDEHVARILHRDIELAPLVEEGADAIALILGQVRHDPVDIGLMLAAAARIILWQLARFDSHKQLS